MARADEVSRRFGFGTARTALIVGGHEDHVRGTISKNLAEVGIHVAAHWQEERTKAIPLDCDLVIVLTDTCSHPTSKHATDAAKRSEVTLVNGSRKWASLSYALLRSRIITQPMLDQAHVQPDSTKPQKEPSVPDKPAEFPVRVHQQNIKTLKTFEELIADLKAASEGLLLAHDVTQIQITGAGIDIRQEKKLKLAF